MLSTVSPDVAYKEPIRTRRCFAAIDLSATTVPDATTVLNFRHWLEEHDLTQALFDEVGAMLEDGAC